MQDNKSVTFSTFPKTLVYALFFMWGFVWNLFNVLAAFFQETFELSNTETSLGTSLSFLAFFLMSYPSKILINKLGTQKAISAGAFTVGLGLLIFVPASLLRNYYVFLAGLFVLFSGVTVLQAVCNPYIGVLGDNKYRSARINFAQGVGAIGAALTAPLGGWFILQLFSHDIFGGIKWFYLIIAAFFFTLSLLVYLTKMPHNPTEIKSRDQKLTDRGGAFRYPHFVFGLAIMFIYMGAEAILYQLMTPYFKEIAGISTNMAVNYSAFIFYGLMVGRLLGAGIMTRFNASIVLGISALISCCLTLGSIVIGGITGVYLIMGIGLFISIVFASIFSLATTNLGRYTNQASSFLIMGISGGFFIPLLFGIVADSFSLRISLFVVVIPLMLTSIYGFAFNYLLNKKALNLEH